jgi:hypothetical protein
MREFGQIRDLTGQTFGRLTAIRVVGFTRQKTRNGKWRSGGAIWECDCECGNTKEIRGGSLTARSHATKSCGCLARELAAARLRGKYAADSIATDHRPSKLVIDLKGQRFGKWLVIAQAESLRYGRVRWLCECSCSARTRRTVESTSLQQGVSQSCGCSRKRIDARDQQVVAA